MRRASCDTFLSSPPPENIVENRRNYFSWIFRTFPARENSSTDETRNCIIEIMHIYITNSGKKKTEGITCMKISFFVTFISFFFLFFLIFYHAVVPATWRIFRNSIKNINSIKTTREQRTKEEGRRKGEREAHTRAKHSVCNAHSSTFYLRTPRPPLWKHSSKNNGEILLHGWNIAFEAFLVFFLIYIAVSSRATTKTNNFYQPAKCTRCDSVALFRSVDYTLEGWRERCPRNCKSAAVFGLELPQEMGRGGKIAISNVSKYVYNNPAQL